MQSERVSVMLIMEALLVCQARPDHRTQSSAVGEGARRQAEALLISNLFARDICRLLNIDHKMPSV